jgi:ferrous iron transport protein B
VDAAVEVAVGGSTLEPNRPAIRPEHEPVLAEVRALIAGCVPQPYPEDWAALKLLEGDKEITALVMPALPDEERAALEALLLKHEDAYLDIAGGRYEWISRMVRAAVTHPKAGAITRTERLDRVATHPVWGLALLLAMFGAVFWLTYTVATPVADWLSVNVLGRLDAGAQSLLAGGPPWLVGLVSGGLISGAGTVLTFLPILVIFFAVLGILEDVGYLSRGAYVMDRFMHLMGLHGKSFLPLFLGFGCNVPAVLGSRIIEDKRARQLTVLLAPLVPCTARLAVIAFLAPAFFGSRAALASWTLVALNLLVLAVAGIAVNRLAFRGEQSAFIMELPLYHMPNARTVGLYVKNNTVAFIRKAGTLILLASAVVWLLSNLPGDSVDESALAYFGRSLEPVGGLMGMDDWRMIVALITSFFAKENTIATLGILYGADPGSTALADQVALTLIPTARWAFLAVAMLFIPCLATVATIRQETGSWRWTAASILLLLAVSLGVGVVVYQVGSVIL